ncbi:MAG: hypothetical protein K6U08_07715 [Firmicutes bacterium]|nr:hypothetical protein [Bacillota bacterium]
MPTRTRGRLGTLVLLSILAAVLVVLASYLYFRAGPRVPPDADIVSGEVRLHAAGVPRVLARGGVLGPAFTASVRRGVPLGVPSKEGDESRCRS